MRFIHGSGLNIGQDNDEGEDYRDHIGQDGDEKIKV